MGAADRRAGIEGPPRFLIQPTPVIPLPVIPAKAGIHGRCLAGHPPLLVIPRERGEKLHNGAGHPVTLPLLVIPAKAGIHGRCFTDSPVPPQLVIPANAGIQRLLPLPASPRERRRLPPLRG